MNERTHFAARGTTMVIGVALLASVSIVRVQARDSPRPMALRGVMQQLGQDMQAVTAAISNEDWAEVTDLAPRIASHAEPPVGEKMRILGWLGTDAGKFRSLDGQLHDAAIAMGEAAARADGPEVIATFGHVQRQCLACHQEFRQPFQEHFYEKR